MKEIWDKSLIPGWGRSHSSILAWRIPMDRGAWWACSSKGCKESDTTKATYHSQTQFTNEQRTWSQFSKEDIQMANMHVKRHPTLLASGKCKSKSRWDSTSYLGWYDPKRPITCVGEVVEKWWPSYMTGKNVNSIITLENSLAVNKITLKPCNSIPKYIPQEMKTYGYTNMHECSQQHYSKQS